VFCTIRPQFGTHIPVHNYEMYIIYIFRFTNQCNIWGIWGSISVYCMLYALMLYSGASVPSFMLCFTIDCISHLIIIAAYSFIITYLLMLYTCTHTHTHTNTHAHSFSQQSSKLLLLCILHVHADSTSV
jgi:hypothetical protein